MRIVVRKSLLDAWRVQKGIKDTSKLVKKEITNKNGHRTTVWVRPDELQKKNNAGTRTKGDIILFIGADGKQHSGFVTAVGRIGVIVEDGKGRREQVKHENVKRVLAKVNDSDAIRNLMDKEHIKLGWRNGEDGMQPEPCDTWEGMTRMATEATKDFSDFSENIRKHFEDSINPKLYKRQTLKKQKRAFEKLWTDEMANRELDLFNEIVEGDDPKTAKYHCRTLRDVDGHTFCCKNIEEVGKMLEYFDKVPKEVIRIKNNFVDPSSLGYSDININVRLPNGTIAEIQLNTTANLVAKENYGHALYEVCRSGKIKDNPKYTELVKNLENAQRNLYDLSNKLSTSGNFPDMNPFGATYKPYGEAIRLDVRKAVIGVKLAYNSGDIDQETYDHFQGLLTKIG